MARKTTKTILKEMLLTGKHINTFDFIEAASSTALQQRVHELRRDDGWDVRSKPIEGKGSLNEYWLEPGEIKRIKASMRETVSLLPGGHNLDSRY